MTDSSSRISDLTTNPLARTFCFTVDECAIIDWCLDCGNELLMKEREENVALTTAEDNRIRQESEDYSQKIVAIQSYLRKSPNK